jgi:hypothetical protein
MPQDTRIEVRTFDVPLIKARVEEISDCYGITFEFKPSTTPGWEQVTISAAMPIQLGIGKGFLLALRCTGTIA